MAARRAGRTIESMSGSETVPTQQQAAPPPPEEHHHNHWRWIAAGFAVIAIGLLVWGVKTQRDLDDANSDKAALTGVSASMKSAYDDIGQQLGSTSQDLSQSQQDVADAQQQATDAEKQASQAKSQTDQAQGAADEAQKEAQQAQADADASEAKLKVAGDCAKAYVSAFGTLLDGASADDVGKDLSAVTADCQDALGG
jgi:hypothetical protein